MATSLLSPELLCYPTKVGGLRTRVIESEGDGAPVLFLHGAGARADRWRRTLPAIAAAGFHGFAIDLPGHGFADKGPDLSYGVPSFADFVEAFLDQNRITQAHLVGTSLGAHTLAEVFLRRPQVALSLTLVGATGLFPIGPGSRARIAASIADNSLEGIERKIRNVIFDQAFITDQMIREEYLINNSPGATDSFAKLAEYFVSRLDEDIVGERLAHRKSHTPLMVAWGEHDRTVPLEVGRRVATLLGTGLVVVPNAAHAPYFENAERFNPILIQFLTLPQGACVHK